MTREDEAGGRAAAARPKPGDPPVVEVSALLGGAREVVIVHKGERYRLRLTHSDKLILTK